MESNVKKISPDYSQTDGSSGVMRQPVRSDFFNDPIKVSFAIGGSLIALALWYISDSVNPKFERQSEDIKVLTQKVDAISEKMMDRHNVSALSDSEIKAQITELTTAINGKFDTFNEKFTNLKSSVVDGMESVASTEKKFDEQLAAIPETKNVVEQLDQQKDVIDRQTDAIETLQTLVQLTDDRPVRQEILQRLAVENAHFLETPEQLATLWETRKNSSAKKFEKELKESYGVVEKDAMLLAYDALTEPKPVRFFLDLEEIKASAEPQIAAALVAENDSNVPLAEPLTIARVCEEISKPVIECFNYFLNISHETDDNTVSFESPSDDAVLKIIIEKHETRVPGD